MDNQKETFTGHADQSKFPSSAQDFGAIESSYANATMTQASNWDVRLLFSERIGDSKIVHKASIVMGHQQAKALYLSLKSSLERLEELMGSPIQFEPQNLPKQGDQG